MINITIPRVLGGFNNDTEKFVDLPAITLPPTRAFSNCSFKMGG